MIVRNEASVLPASLQSLLPFIDCYSIVDTGSTDDTVTIIHQQLGHLPGVVTPQEWRDFSSARNLSLEIARQLGDYVFVFDADDLLEATITGLDLRYQLVADVHHLIVRHGATLYQRPWLLRSSIPASFRGVVHEFLAIDPVATGGGQIDGLTIKYNGAGISHRNRDQSAKYAQDVSLLQDALLTCDDPHLASRYTFYLATSLEAAGRHKEAAQVFGDRTRLSNGFIDEVYVSFLRLGHLSTSLYSNVRMRLHMYLMAYQTDPTRAEAQYYIAEFARSQKWWNLSWPFISDGLQRTLDPSKLFVEFEVYEWRLRYEHSISAWYHGDFESGRSSCEWLLLRSDLPRGIVQATERNLNLYLSTE